MPLSRPSVIPTIDSNSTNRSAPPAGKQTDGYVNTDIFPAPEFNWTQGFTSDWLAWLDERTADGATPARDLALQGVAATGASGDAGGFVTITSGAGDLAGAGGDLGFVAGVGGVTARGRDLGSSSIRTDWE